jgi:glutaredoxin-like YruB-family protein
LKVKVYSSDTCPFCRMVKDFLNENNVAFEEADVSEDHAAAHEMVEKSGQMGIPVTTVSDKDKEVVIVGFDVPKLKKALKVE